jgi:tryptophan halogenase
MSSSLDLDDIPRRDPQAQLVIGDDGDVHIVKSGNAWHFSGLSRDVLERLLAVVDGRRSVREICAAIGSADRPAPLLEVLNLLLGSAFLNGSPKRHNGTNGLLKPNAGAKIAVLANGRLGGTIQAELLAQGFRDSTIVEPRSFQSCLDLDFQLDVLVRVVSPKEDGAFEGLSTTPIEVMTSDDLQRVFSSHDLVIAALEGMRYRALLDVNAAAVATGRPCLIVMVDGRDVVIGPMIIRGQTACLACSLLSTTFSGYADRAKGFALLPLFTTARLSDPFLPLEAAKQVVSAIDRYIANPPAALAFNLVRLSPNGEIRATPVGVLDGCPACAVDGTAGDPGALVRRHRISVSLIADGVSESRTGGVRPPVDQPYQSVGILGGGTAGYLTAIALRTRLPHLSVTLIESSRIPIIGVGEATTPRLLDFMHVRSGLDIVDFYRRVRPTWKVGIRFFWGRRGNYSFNGAFQFGSLVEPMVYNGTIDDYSLGSCLMARDKVPIFDNGDGTYSSYLHRVPFAYHLDNVRFVRYLQEEAGRLGVRQLDRVIADAELAPDGGEIACLIDDAGGRHAFDLYVDASGFRSFLLERKLGSKFISYGSSLFTDGAVMANVPHDGTIKPYTTAESMDSGWCWNIPFEDSDHRGYVFSSQFCSVDDAMEEMRRKNPAMTEPWSLKFKSGRHEHFWRGNVVAVGNAYAFVEPLESTGLEMLTIELDHLIEHFPARRDEGVKRALTQKLNGMWDNIRGLLAVHYKFNQKFDTPFWRACRSETDLADAESRVALFAERAPLSHSRALFRARDPIADFFSQEYMCDVMLCGMQVPARFIEPFESRASFDRRQESYRECARWAIGQADALDMLRSRPDTLAAIFDHEDSWIRLRRY